LRGLAGKIPKQRRRIKLLTARFLIGVGFELCSPPGLRGMSADPR
jgi:hypothetical protein